MRLSDLAIGKTYIIGKKTAVNTGLYGIPVVVLAKGKFTTVTQPCGQMIIPFDGEKRVEVVVAVRNYDAMHLGPRNSWSPRLPRYRGPEYLYTQEQIEQDRLSGRGNVPRSVTYYGQHWVARLIPASKIVMSEEEFRTKEGPAREIYDALNASLDRQRRTREAFDAAVRDLKRRVNPRSSGLRPQENVTISLDDYIKLVEKANIRGTKTSISTVKARRDDMKDAQEQAAKARSCVAEAGLSA